MRISETVKLTLAHPFAILKRCFHVPDATKKDGAGQCFRAVRALGQIPTHKLLSAVRAYSLPRRLLPDICVHSQRG